MPRSDFGFLGSLGAVARSLRGRLLLLCLLPAGAAAASPQAPVPPGTSVSASSLSSPVGRGEVTIPAAEYRALLEAADVSGGAVPAQAKIENARFRVDLDGDTADLEETFDVRVSGTGWLSVPVIRGPLDRAAVVPADRGAFFAVRDLTRLAVLGPGSATATLGARVRLATDSNGRRFFSVAMPLLAVQRGRVELPGLRLDVVVTGGELLRRSEQAGATLLEVAVRPGAALSVAFREQNLAEKGTSAALKASASVYSRSDIVGPNLVTDVTARITAAAGRIGGIAFEIPAGYRLLFLRGAGLLAAETEGGIVRASRASPSPDPLEAQLRLTRPLEDGAAVALPLPRLLLEGPVDAYAELRPPPGVLVEMTDPGSFEPVEIEKITPPLRPLAAEAEEVLHLEEKTGAAAARPALYTLHRLEAAPVLVAQVRAAHGQTVVSANGYALSRIEYEVISSAKPFLTVRLTPGSRFWGAEAMGRPILPAMPEAGSVAVPLRGGRRRIARVAIYVLSPVSLPKGKGTLEFQPPATDIPISTLSWSFSLPPGATYRLSGSEYREGAGNGGSPLDAAAAPARQTEIGQRAQEAFARAAQASGRSPIVPRMPDLQIAMIARTELPGSIPRPIRFDVKTAPSREEWQ